MTALAKLNGHGGLAILRRIAERFGLEVHCEWDGRPLRRSADGPIYRLVLGHVGLGVERVDLSEPEFDLRRTSTEDRFDYVADEVREASQRLRGHALRRWLTDGETGLPRLNATDGVSPPERMVGAGPQLVDALADLIRMVAKDDPTLLERAGTGLLTTYERATKESR